ncbi:hypothetical protein [Smaragdicoccus niigatensis]|uniref:hypothetical protein n=1 Tax=Smaragdicoccus niigatensis TaxID=359359 RepID=UPI0003777FB4|nr:hypothetical protein [Smaragdicoccus niigatensis]
MARVSGSRIGAWWLLAATPVILILTHYAAVLPHEFGHSFMAWALGLKPDPLNIHWGGSSIANVLLLINIDEHVDYSAAFDAGKNWQVAAVAFAGPGLANGGMLLLSRWGLTRRWLRSHSIAGYVLFWFYFFNVVNLYCYIPLRVFTTGDVHNFIRGTGISPWAVYIVGTYVVAWAMVDLYRNALPWVLATCGFRKAPQRAIMLVLVTLIAFVYYDVPALMKDDVATTLLARTSLALVPVVLLFNWRQIVGSRSRH